MTLCETRPEEKVLLPSHFHWPAHVSITCMFIFGVSQMYITEILQLYWSVNMFHKLCWRQWLVSVAHVLQNTSLNLSNICSAFVFVFFKKTSVPPQPQTSDASQQADCVRTLRELHEPQLPSDQRYPVRLQEHWWETLDAASGSSFVVVALWRWTSVFVLGRCCFPSDDLFPTPSSLSTGHNVLIVAHASSLEACTRQLQGRSPQSPKDFIQVVRKVCSHFPVRSSCNSFTGRHVVAERFHGRIQVLL